MITDAGHRKVQLSLMTTEICCLKILLLLFIEFSTTTSNQHGSSIPQGWWGNGLQRTLQPLEPMGCGSSEKFLCNIVEQLSLALPCVISLQ